MIKIIVTRSANDKLYNIFKSLWRDDNIFIQKKEFAGFNGAVDYLLHLLTCTDYDGFIVNADEDFFCINENLIDSVIGHMVKNDIVYCGVPDGGIISHRNKSPFNSNPFFNVFNVSAIRAKILEFDNSKQFEYANKVEKNGNLDEPFAGLFYWLHLNFKHTNFTHIESTDGISTVIKINDEPIGIHSWYSREYGKDKAQTDRINNCIEYAVLKQK